MYFFYIDESGSRDPSVGTVRKPKDHIYVLLAVGLLERQWRPFDQTIARTKLAFVAPRRLANGERFQRADCEVKSNWLRAAKERAERRPFLHALTDDEREKSVAAYARPLGRTKQSGSLFEEPLMSGWANHIEPTRSTRHGKYLRELAHNQGPPTRQRPHHHALRPRELCL